MKNLHDSGVRGLKRLNRQIQSGCRIRPAMTHNFRICNSVYTESVTTESENSGAGMKRQHPTLIIESYAIALVRTTKYINIIFPELDIF